jgi:hypothetical protein
MLLIRTKLQVARLMLISIMDGGVRSLASVVLMDHVAFQKKTKNQKLIQEAFDSNLMEGPLPSF